MKNWMNDLIEGSPVARYIAWAGCLEFAGAQESDSGGRTVTFLLRRSAEELASAHPFSSHTRRRRGHAGTMFTMSLAAFDGETPATKDGLYSVMLMHWASGPKGDTVKFLLNFESESHPFLGCQRAAKDVRATRWMVTFIEENEQSQLVDQAQRDEVELVKPKQQLRNSNLAAVFTKDKNFWRFIGDWAKEEVLTAQYADQLLKDYCMVDSKSTLDSDPTAAAEFTRLRQDFVVWQQDNGIDPAA